MTRRRAVKVLALLDKRIGARLVTDFLQDLTPPEEYERAREARQQNAVVFPQGFGRPTKKQRREIDRLQF